MKYKNILLPAILFISFLFSLHAQTYTLELGINKKNLDGNITTLGGDEWNFAEEWILRMNKADLISKVMVTNKNLTEISGNFKVEVLSRTGTTVLLSKTIPFSRIKVTAQVANIPINLNFTEVSGLTRELKLKVSMYVGNESVATDKKNIKRLVN
jgi:hypothetical protein